MAFTTEQLFLIAGIVLIIYTLIGARGLSLGKVTLPTLLPLTRIGLVSIGGALILMGVASRLYHEEYTFETPTIDNRRIDICLYSGGIACGYEAATTWCRGNGYKLASIWSVDGDIGHTEIMGTRNDCGSDECSAFRTITCMR